jgi:NAD(P)-dependent dehydrogenase (short-subunit alcohol dehydrogenase family)
VVVAADSAVGAACVAHFLSEGAAVTALASSSDHPGPERRQAVELVAASGGAAELYDVDFGDVDALRAIARELGPIRALVNAHFALHVAGVRETPMTVWSEAIRTNLLDPVASTQAFVPNLEQGRPSSIGHVGSVDGLLGNPLVAAYPTTKGCACAVDTVSAGELAPARHPSQLRGARWSCREHGGRTD